MAARQVSCRLLRRVDQPFVAGLRRARLRRVAQKTLAQEGLSGQVEVSLVVCDDATIQQLNATYRGIDEPTDVMAFPLLDSGLSTPPGFPSAPDGVLRLGDVVISYPRACAQAAECGHPVPRELEVLLVHGLLHLLGYRHETPEERERMLAKAEAVLEGL